MRSAQIRQSFIDFFAARGHRPVPSSPLVPHGDATLLFTNAGMVQFKDYFTGAATPEFRRAVTAQKCLRVSGKHNDLENVGPSPRHHTFFEMLGNFSFGDYFKADAIEFAWQLVTKEWGLDPANLFASVFETDDEAGELWAKISGLPAGRIVRCGEKDNFWAMGETGPCGPCSEIYVDRHPDRAPVSWDEGTDSGRYLEIWNLVFMQFERSKAKDGTISTAPLPEPSIDTGAGLERVAAVVGGVDSNYDTDLFRPILDATATLAGVRYGAAPEQDVSMRVVADHLRAVAFLLADGVIPSNEGRGYVLRRLLRRAVRHGMRLGFEEPFLCRLLPTVDEAMAGFYTELAATRAASESTVRAEEEKFLSTVAIGSKMVQEAIEETKKGGGGALAGERVFKLYDTYGLPIQLLREIAEEEKFALDEAGFESALAGQRERSRAATGDSQKRLGALKATLTKLGPLPATRFLGYDRFEIEGARVLRALRARGEDFEILSGEKAHTREGEEGVVIFDQSPFYAESGGQVGDVGEIRWDGGSAQVLDTQKDGAGVVLHFVRFADGAFPLDQQLLLSVSREHRLPTQRNHTATHLLHAALRKVLGTGVRQAGSLVAPDHLRFDFTHGKPLSEAERALVQALVDEWVLKAVPTRITDGREYKEAVAAGAMALFGEKYGDRVRTVEVPGFSLELCGGCHVANTGEIGPFVLRAERGVASGVRRIEALTGEGALGWLRGRDRGLAEVETALGAAGAGVDGALAAVSSLKKELKEKEAELAKLRLKLVSGTAGAASEETVVEGVRILVREVPPAPPGELRAMADALKAKLGSGVVLLGARGDGKVALIAAVSDDLKGRVPAGKLLKALAVTVGGSGGGRDDFAQAGGKSPERLPEAFAQAPKEIGALLAG